MMLDQHVPLQNGVQQNDKLSQYIQEVEMAEGGQRAFASRELSAARLRARVLEAYKALFDPLHSLERLLVIMPITYTYNSYNIKRYINIIYHIYLSDTEVHRNGLSS